jgi:hypothetical protein
MGIEQIYSLGKAGGVDPLSEPADARVVKLFPLES